MLSPTEIAKNRVLMKHARAWIKHLSLTQSKIAERMGVSEPTVSKWLDGKQPMTTAQLTDLLKILDIPIEAFLSPPGDNERALIVKRLLNLARDITAEELTAIESLISRRPKDPK
jgi:transcriptional regulator with XRE-family HTH domain